MDVTEELEAGGDIFVNHSDKFKRTSLVDKLLSISEESGTNLPKLPPNSITGWFPSIIAIPPGKKLHAISIPKSNDTRKQILKKPRLKPDIVSCKIPPIGFKNVQTKSIISNKSIKFGMKRLEELAAPKNIRSKIKLDSYKRYEMPVKRTVSLDETSNDINTSSDIGLTDVKSEKEELDLFKAFMRKIPNIDKQIIQDHKILRKLVSRQNMHKFDSGVSQIALHYGIGGPELRKKQVQNDGQGKKVLTPVIRSPKEVFSEKLKGISLPHSKKRTELAPVVDKSKPESLFDMQSSETQTIVIKKGKNNEANLPFPNANISFQVNQISNKQKNSVAETYNWDVTSLLPSIMYQQSSTKLKCVKYKKTLGSVTAITQGTIKGGFGSNSIGKLQRKPLPAATIKPIVPRISGTHAEVPLLPLSPDFLRKIT